MSLSDLINSLGIPSNMQWLSSIFTLAVSLIFVDAILSLIIAFIGNIFRR